MCICARVYDDSLVMTLTVMFMAFLCLPTHARRIPFFLFVSLFEVARQHHHSYTPYIIHVSLIFISVSLSLSDDKNLLFLSFSTCFVLVLVCYAFFQLNKQMPDWISLIFRVKKKKSFVRNHTKEKRLEIYFSFDIKERDGNWQETVR